MLATLPSASERALPRHAPRLLLAQTRVTEKKEPSKLATAFLARLGSVSDSPTGDLCFGAKRIHKWHPCNTKSGVKRPTTALGISARRPPRVVLRPTRASCQTPPRPTGAKILARPQRGRRWSRGGGAVATGQSRELLYSFVFSSIRASGWPPRPPIRPHWAHSPSLILSHHRPPPANGYVPLPHPQLEPRAGARSSPCVPRASPSPRRPSITRSRII